MIIRLGKIQEKPYRGGIHPPPHPTHSHLERPKVKTAASFHKRFEVVLKITEKSHQKSPGGFTKDFSLFVIFRMLGDYFPASLFYRFT